VRVSSPIHGRVGTEWEGLVSMSREREDGVEVCSRGVGLEGGEELALLSVRP